MDQLDSLNIFAQIPVNVYWKNKDGVYLGCNEYATKMFELQSSQKIIGKTDYDLSLNIDYVKPIIANDLAVLEGGQEKIFEEAWIKKDGQYASYLSKKDVLSINGKTIGIIGVSIELTSNINKISKVAQELNNYLYGIVNALGSSIYWKSKQGFYLGCNAYAAKMAGLAKPENIIGKTDYDLFSREEADNFRINDLQVIRSGQELFTEEIVISPTGKSLIQLSIKKPLYDKDGIVIGLLEIL